MLTDSGGVQRIQLMDSSSYQALDGGWKQHLTWLHNDYFYHRHNKLWSENALRTLPVLMSATNMLVCGEDLGMIPSCVPPVLQQLGLIGALHPPIPLPRPSHGMCRVTCSLQHQ